MYKDRLPPLDQALPGRPTPMPLHEDHFVLHRPLLPPFPEDMARALFGMGCFWGAERLFWSLPGVWITAVGYAAGFTPNPNYREVCTGLTGHNEVVLVVYTPRILPYETLLRTFWEGHDPTQGMRQANDQGTQYRSGIYCFDTAQRNAAETSRARYQETLRDAARGPITTEIRDAQPFFYAEDYHQQYLTKNPGGYCGLGGLGIPYPKAGN